MYWCLEAVLEMLEFSGLPEVLLRMRIGNYKRFLSSLDIHLAVSVCIRTYRHAY